MCYISITRLECCGFSGSDLLVFRVSFLTQVVLWSLRVRKVETHTVNNEKGITHGLRHNNESFQRTLKESKLMAKIRTIFDKEMTLD